MLDFLCVLLKFPVNDFTADGNLSADGGCTQQDFVEGSVPLFCARSNLVRSPYISVSVVTEALSTEVPSPSW